MEGLERIMHYILKRINGVWPACHFRMICLISLLAFLSSCGEQPAQDQPTDVAVPVEITRLWKGDYEDTLPVTGSIYAKAKVTLSALSDASIRKLHAVEGQRVHQGDILVEQDDTDLAARVSKALANLNQVKAELEQKRKAYQRDKSLVKRGAVTQEELEERLAQMKVKKAEVVVRQADLDEALQRFDQSSVYAPFDGIVTNLRRGENEFIKKGEEIVDLVSLESMEFRADFYETDLFRLKAQIKARVRVDAIPGKVYEGPVSAFLPEATGAARSLQLRVAMDNREGRLLEGLFARGEIILDRKEGVLFLHKDGGIRDNGKIIFYTVADGKASKRIGDMAGEKGDWYVLPQTESCKEGMPVIVTGLSGVEDGVAVKVTREIKTEVLSRARPLFEYGTASVEKADISVQEGIRVDEGLPLAVLGVSGNVSDEQLKDLCRKELWPELLKLADIASVVPYVVPSRDFVVELDKTKLRKHSLTVEQVRRQLLIGPVTLRVQIRGNGKEQLRVKNPDGSCTLDRLKQFSISNIVSGDKVSLQEIASIKPSSPVPTAEDQRPHFYFSLYAKGGLDTSSVVLGLEHPLDAFRQSHEDLNIKYYVLYMQGGETHFAVRLTAPAPPEWLRQFAPEKKSPQP